MTVVQSDPPLRQQATPHPAPEPFEDGRLSTPYRATPGSSPGGRPFPERSWGMDPREERLVTHRLPILIVAAVARNGVIGAGDPRSGGCRAT